MLTAMTGLLLIAIVFSDIRDGIIPNWMILIGIVINLIDALLKEPTFSAVLTTLFQGLIIALPVLVIVLMMDKILKRPSMGGGDIKLIFMLGMTTTPLQSVFALTLACISALVFILIADKRWQDSLPFGPALCLGWTIVWIVLNASLFF